MILPWFSSFFKTPPWFCRFFTVILIHPYRWAITNSEFPKCHLTKPHLWLCHALVGRAGKQDKKNLNTTTICFQIIKLNYGMHFCLIYHNEIRQELVEPLEILFTISPKSSTLPMDWRSANITAIYKKGSKKDPSNYRPISLICIICKIMESIIRDFIVDYFVSNGFF